VAESTPQSFARALRDLRVSRGLTQQALAQACRLSSAQVNRYENGLKPSPASVGRIARALGADAERLAVLAMRDALHAEGA
jgi:transcriptional regulator with XRE-family HTH domain